MKDPDFLPLPSRKARTPEEMAERARRFRERMGRRRTVRDYSGEPVPREVIENCILAAGSAPSGANRQPWHFVAVSDPGIKKRIREAAEKEEEAFYSGRAPDEWLEALRPLGTTADKPFLEIAPWLIVVFAETAGIGEGKRIKNYYVAESVGIATGILISAVHDAGLASLTHTPSPMKFLNEILHRPPNEKPFLVLVVGRPAAGARVPDIEKKKPAGIATFIEGAPEGDS